MKFVFDPAEERLLLPEEAEAIEKELAQLIEDYGIEAVENLMYHDMGYTTDGKYEFIMGGHGDYIFVTRYGPEDEVTEHPNA